MGEDEDDNQRDRFVVLLRHGIAEDRTADKPDDQRSLTSEGHARMKAIARGLARVFPKAQAIYSSPLLRAVQTSLWVSKGYRSRIKVQTSELLSPGATAKDFLAFINSTPERRVVLVGHEPTFTDNVMELIGLSGGSRVELKKGGCYGLRIRPDGKAVLEWLLSPRILRKLSEGE